LSGLTYASTSFVKMTAAGTFTLDTATYGTSDVSVANQGSDRIITATTTADALNAEANLTFNGTILKNGVSTSGTYTALDNTNYGILYAQGDGTPGAIFRSFNDSYAHNNIITAYRSGGTVASPAAAPTNARVYREFYQVYDGTVPRDAGEHRFEVDGAVATDDFDTKWVWYLKEGASSPALMLTLGVDGFEYAADHSTDQAANPRWIPDKEYVDGLGVTIGNTGEVPHSDTGTPGTDFDYSANFTFASNILTVVGTIRAQSTVSSPTSYVTMTSSQFNMYISSTQRVLFYPDVTDGASAVAFTMGTDNDLTTAGAKLFQLQNQAIEKFYVDKDGTVSALGDIFAGVDTSLRTSADRGINISTTSTDTSSVLELVGTDDGTGTLGAITFHNTLATSATAEIVGQIQVIRLGDHDAGEMQFAVGRADGNLLNGLYIRDDRIIFATSGAGRVYVDDDAIYTAPAAGTTLGTTTDPWGGSFLAEIDLSSGSAKMGWYVVGGYFQVHTGSAFVSIATGDFSINASGNVFMANLTNTTSGNYLYYDSTTKEVTYATTSDIRLKKNIVAWTPDSLEFLVKQPLIKFDRKDGSNYGEIGWDATAMRELMPEMTWLDEEGYVNYYDAHMRFHFHRSIKQIAATQETQEQKIKRLEERVAELERA